MDFLEKQKGIYAVTCTNISYWALATGKGEKASMVMVACLYLDLKLTNDTQSGTPALCVYVLLAPARERKKEINTFREGCRPS